MSAVPKINYQHLFPIPFLTRECSENARLNTDLRLRILAHSRETRGEQKSNSGGWHSGTGQLEFLGDLRIPIIRQIYECADEATRRVLAESASPPVAIELTDPCMGRANTVLPFLLPSSVAIRPRAGLMILFPGYLSHAVQVQRGSGTRISIAFNLRKEPFP
jgi:hypothetical protein